MVTMADVAKLAGVSVTTVSHVVNGTREASAETTRRVLEAVERTGYVHNALARGLARARTQSIGLVVPGLAAPSLAAVIAGAEAEATRAGHVLLLADSHDDPRQELRVVQALVGRRVDGLLLAPSAGAAELALRHLAGQEVPVVLLDRLLDAGLDQAGVDNEGPTAELVEHVAANGHERIAFLAGRPGISTTAERLRGYRLAIARRGLAELVADGGSSVDGGAAATAALLDRDAPPTAIVSGNDEMTIGVLRVLRERGVRVPDDVAVVGFDDFPWAPVVEPRLTVLAQPAAELGATAVRLLLERLDEPSRPPRTIRLPPTFVHRGSCGCALAA
jgi:LacI family transcriptional regulator